MTCNQLIVLMDVRRGFREEGHMGTMNDDIEMLKNAGLIESGERFPLQLTEAGAALSDEVLKRANELVILQRHKRNLERKMRLVNSCPSKED